MAGYGQLFSGQDCFDILSVLDFPMEGLEGEEDVDWEPNLQGLPPIPAEAIPSELFLGLQPSDIGVQSSSMLLNPNSNPYLSENSSTCSFEKKISMLISSEFSIPHCARNKRSKRSRCTRFHPWFEMPCIPCKNPSASIKASNMKRKLSKTSAPAAIRMKKNSTEWHAGDATRKCTHCEVTKTPQWREGPLGPKTLCNACGVRYRSGRLFPEYRPAASPTFVPSLHSNAHRKVIEIRKIAEMEAATNEALAEVVPETLPPYEFMVTCFLDNMVR